MDGLLSLKIQVVISVAFQVTIAGAGAKAIKFDKC